MLLNLALTPYSPRVQKNYYLQRNDICSTLWLSLQVHLDKEQMSFYGYMSLCIVALPNNIRKKEQKDYSAGMLHD
jgi:hypothetical protein